MHDLGNVSPSALTREADIAQSHLMTARKALVGRDLALAMDHYFKAAAIAVNIAFTSRTHEIPVASGTMQSLQSVCEEAAGGIYKIMKVVVTRKISKHNRLLHPDAARQRRVLIKTSRPVDLWFRLSKKGIPLKNLRMLPEGVAVTGCSVQNVREALAK